MGELLTSEKLEIIKNQENCAKGNHQLEIIYKSNIGWNETNVVRWCKHCGSVVVDTDSDNRTRPGNIMKMRKPSFL